MRATTLVAVLLALLVLPSAARAYDYVAMGDSYSAGTGTRDYSIDQDCNRSPKAYGSLIKSSFGSTFLLNACSGARTGGVLDNQVQALSADTDYVTISIGGNDAGFSDVITTCLLPDTGGNCDGDINTAQAYIRDTLPGRLNLVYTQIKNRAPNAKVVVAGYPRLFNGEDCHLFTWFSANEMTRLNQTANLLADTIRARTQDYGFGFVDVRTAFNNHAVCDNVEWINNLSNPVSDSFHPNVAGHRDGYAPLVKAALQDSGAPTTQITSGPTGLVRSTSASFSFGSNDLQATYQCRMDSGAWTSCTTPYGVTGLSQGAHTFSVRATDRFGYTEEPKQRKFTVDTVAPAAPSVTAPASPTAATQPELAFTGEAGATFECATDTGAFAACTSPYTPDPLDDGPHTLKVRQTDAAGNLGAVRSVTVVVDTTAPATTIDDGPAGPTADATPAFAFTADDAAATFECRIDDAEFAACASPFEPATLDDGPHAFEVRATDAVGNAETTAARREFTVDTTAPATTIESGPSGLTAFTAAEFTFAAEDGATFACRIDDAEFAACTSPFRAEGLGEGDHAFEVKATDALGNAEATAARREFTVDTTAPAAPTLGGPEGAIADAEPQFTLAHDEDGVTFACSVGAATPAACTSPYAPGALADGPHTVSVVAIDAAGNTSPAATRSVTVDTTAPATTIEDGPDGPTADATPAFAFSADDDAATFECRIDDGDFAACASPFQAPELAEGDHAFEVLATDALGNTAAAAVRREFTVDTTAPVTTLVTGPQGTVADARPQFTFTADDAAATFECRVDGADFAPCASPFATQALADGDHAFEVRARDAVGNTEAAAVRRAFRVDTSVPAPPPAGGGGGPAPQQQPQPQGQQPPVQGQSQSRSNPLVTGAPVLRSVKLSKKVLRGRTAKALLRFRLSAPARLTVKLERRGIKGGKFRYRTARTLRATGKAGAGRLTIAVRVKGKVLARGTYRLTITPQGGKAVRLTFRVA